MAASWPDRKRRGDVAVRAGIGLAVLAGLLLAALAVPTPLARSMAVHVVLMSLAAPATIWALGARSRRMPQPAPRPALGLAVAIQSLLLYAWHLPLGSSLAMLGAPGMVAMQATLFLAAVYFWRAVAASLATHWWRAVLALLVTGKLFCLLGMLLVLAPRLLGHGGMDLPDQQLAGLIMLAACPPTYVGAALVVCCRGIPGLMPARAGRAHPRPS